MDTTIDILIVLLICFVILLLCYASFKFRTKSEKEYDEGLKKSLEDEFIIDPETGAKLTLEQAESGHWISHDNEFNTMSDIELEKLPSEDHRIIQTAINYLKGSKSYVKTELTEEQFQTFHDTKILKSYDDWQYSHPFTFNEGILILPTPELRSDTYYQEDYCESHLMFWVNVDDIKGHYVFREKTSSEKFLDLIRNDDELELKNYECFVFKKSYHIIQLKNILKHFEHTKGLEIEIHNENLFIKTTKLANLDEILLIENIIKNVC